ncbi:MAG: flagellar biosynthesis anti-sigma factor FlgM [Sphingomonas sp.]|nr:flagellar biosynthesis anti-sigma factor FlgM [Sphingomonas sp.]
MVEAVGAKPVTTVDRRVAPVAPSVAVAPAPKPVPEETSGATASAIARDLAAQAPVNAERVARIRKAIAEGRYPIAPETVADRLIALKLEWSPHDPS